MMVSFVFVDFGTTFGCCFDTPGRPKLITKQPQFRTEVVRNQVVMRDMTRKNNGTELDCKKPYLFSPLLADIKCIPSFCHFLRFSVMSLFQTSSYPHVDGDLVRGWVDSLLSQMDSPFFESTHSRLPLTGGMN